MIILIIIDIVPKLIDFDWRVDIKMQRNMTNNDGNSKSGQQTCVLQFQVSFKYINNI